MFYYYILNINLTKLLSLTNGFFFKFYENSTSFFITNTNLYSKYKIKDIYFKKKKYIYFIERIVNNKKEMFFFYFSYFFIIICISLYLFLFFLLFHTFLFYSNYSNIFLYI